jgi:hypothetical protein
MNCYQVLQCASLIVKALGCQFIDNLFLIVFAIPTRTFLVGVHEEIRILYDIDPARFAETIVLSILVCFFESLVTYSFTTFRSTAFELDHLFAA